jgi:hypothetical protein
MNQKKHFHVLAGQDGYLPDYNEVYDNEADAIAGMHDLADLFNDQIAEKNAVYYEWDKTYQEYQRKIDNQPFLSYIRVQDCDCDVCEE